MIGPACPLCGEPAAFTLKVEAGGALHVLRRFGGGGREQLERAYDAWLGQLPEAQQDALTDALARCTGDAERAALMRRQHIDLFIPTQYDRETR